MSTKREKENASLPKSSLHNGEWPEKLVNPRNMALVQGKRKRMSAMNNDDTSRSRQSATKAGDAQFLVLDKKDLSLQTIPNPAPLTRLDAGRFNVQYSNHRVRSSALPLQAQLSDLSEVPDSEEDTSGGSSGSESARKQPRPSLQTPYESSLLPTELAFYRGTWVDILEYAKKQFLVWLVTKCAWPQRETHLINAENCLLAAIEAYRKKGDKIEEDYYPTYKREMSSLIFDESSVLYSALLTMACQIAQEKYDLDPDWISGFGQVAYAEYVSVAAKELMDTSQFMHHGIDKQGKRNNFNHPALEELSTSFFYGSADSVGILFPDQMKDTLSHNALALACEALHCALMELVHGIKYIFTATPIYEDMHEVLMGLIEKIDNDEYHGSKLRCSLAKWAHNGRIRCGVHQESLQTYGLQVYLD